MGATIYDVVRESGFALGTVSRVINSATNVNPSTRSTILEVMERLGYQPNTVARSLASGASRSIALMVPDLANPFFGAVAAGVEEVTDPLGYTVLVGSGSSDIERERRHLRLLAARQVDGMLLIGSNLTVETLLELTDGTPVVQIDREVKGTDAAVVKLDHRLGGHMATSHLLDLGHTRIAFLGGAEDNDASRARFWGYEDALKERGLEPTPDLISRAGLDLPGGIQTMVELLERKVALTAVFASNDMMAIGAMGKLRNSGLSVPDDVSIVGFDDNYLAAYTSPPLTTIRQSASELGRHAAEVLLHQINKEPFETRVILMPELVVRQSTGRV